MSAWLTSSVFPKSASRLLAEIDEESESAANVQRGPFGAFRIGQDPSSPPPDQLSEASTDTYPPEPSQDLISGSSPWTQYLVQTILEDSGDMLMPSSPDFWDIQMDSGRIQEIFDDVPLPEIPDFGLPLPPRRRSPSPFPMSMPSLPLSSLSSVNTSVPQDAVLLLNHYGTTVINSLTPFRHTKTPWHVLFLPQAKHCLAALMLGEQLDNASLTLFYGTLAMSAFSLGGLSQSQMWLEQGNLYQRQARDRARLMLRTAYAIPKVAKYKTTLMALLTMVQVSLFSGKRDQTELFLLEAEKYIRLRGLKRKKSHRVRLLHHCYVFERIFHESMFITDSNSFQRHQVRNAVESSGLIVYGSDAPSFRIFPWTDLTQEMLRVKGQEEGENDLFLERPGFWAGDLYPEVYGVPQTWLFLLSQVIRLGNEKDAAENEPATSSLNLKDFTSRAKSLEKCINQLQSPSQTTNGFDADQNGGGRSPSEYLLEAMHHALALYFYRRIHDVDTVLLQPKVVSIRDCLLRCETIDPSLVYSSSGFIWPAFIAACEAEDFEVQLSFSTWFTNCAQRSGLSSFTTILETVEQVWQEKWNANGSSVTWLDLMKKNAMLRPHG